MRKDWFLIALALTMLAACTTDTQQQVPKPQQPAYNGPLVEIGGVEPRYEPVNPGTNQDYSVNGKNYKIIKDPVSFSEVGLATWYGEEANGNRTATGEKFDANALAAAHPTLPLPSYVRITNLANGRMIVVRVNDRGPNSPGRIIDLTRAAGNRLNISNNTKVRLDYIAVAPDGSLSGPGTQGTTVAKQSYALPARPDISSSMAVMSSVDSNSFSGHNVAPKISAQPAATLRNIRPVDHSTLSSDDNNMRAPIHSSGFLGAAQPLRNRVLEGSEPDTAPVVSVSYPATVSGSVDYVVQVEALSDRNRARQLAISLGKQFAVPGSVDNRGNIYRVQLGHFSSRQQAVALQQRLAAEAQQSSFITVAPDVM